MTTFDSDTFDLKFAHIDRLAVRIVEALDTDPATVLYGLPVGVGAAAQLVNDGAVLHGYSAANTGGADATLLIGGPDVSATAFHDALIVPAGSVARAVLPNRGIRFVSGIAALAVGNALSVTLWWRLDCR